MDWQSIWQVLQPFAAERLKRALVAAAMSLVAHGVIPADQQSAFVSVTFSIACYLAAEAASFLATRQIPKLQSKIVALERELFGKKPPAPSVAARAQPLTPSGGTQGKP